MLPKTGEFRNLSTDEAIEAGKELADTAIKSLRANIGAQKTISSLDDELSIYRIDELTGVLLRRAYKDDTNRLRSEVHAGTEPRGFDTVVIAMADLRRMHAINNRGGQEAGNDELLKLANRMGSIFEENNDIVSIPARLGGDEFAVTVAFDSSKYPIESIKKGLYEGIVVWGETETPHGVRMGDVAVSSIEKEISELFSEADPKKPKTWLQRFKKQIADQRHERRRQKAKQAA